MGRKHLFAGVALLLIGVTMLAGSWNAVSFYFGEPGAAQASHSVKEEIPVERRDGYSSEVAPQKASGATAENISKICVYLCRSGEGSSAAVEVLLFQGADTKRYCGWQTLREGETPKLGARRWLKQHYGLGLIDVETTCYVPLCDAKAKPHNDSPGERSAIAVVVRPVKLPGDGTPSGPESPSLLPGKASFLAIEDFMRAPEASLSAEVLEDRPDLNTFLIPWIKTAGKNMSACGGAKVVS